MSHFFKVGISYRNSNCTAPSSTCSSWHCFTNPTAIVTHQLNRIIIATTMATHIAVVEHDVAPLRGAGPYTAVFCLDIISAPIADVMSRSYGFKLVRTVYMSTEEISSSRIKISEVWANGAAKVILFKNLSIVHGHMCEDWFAAATADIDIAFALIMDGMYTRQPLAEAHDSCLRYMSTSTVQSADGTLGSALSALQKLDIGQLVTSCGALVITRYEHIGTPAVIILSQKELAYSVDSAKCFERAHPYLLSVLGSVPHLPNREDYAKYVAIDPYLINTGNMYN